MVAFHHDPHRGDYEVRDTQSKCRGFIWKYVDHWVCRVDDMQRRSVLSGAFEGLGFSASQIDELVAITGSTKNHDNGFTFSDLTQRLLPAIVLDAYSTRPVNSDRALEIARDMMPTPPFEEKSR